jgi:hypothetical protein
MQCVQRVAKQGCCAQDDDAAMTCTRHGALAFAMRSIPYQAKSVKELVGSTGDPFAQGTE